MKNIALIRHGDTRFIIRRTTDFSKPILYVFSRDGTCEVLTSISESSLRGKVADLIVVGGDVKPMVEQVLAMIVLPRRGKIVYLQT